MVGLLVKVATTRIVQGMAEAKVLSLLVPTYRALEV